MASNFMSNRTSLLSGNNNGTSLGNLAVSYSPAAMPRITDHQEEKKMCPALCHATIIENPDYKNTYFTLKECSVLDREINGINYIYF